MQDNRDSKDVSEQAGLRLEAADQIALCNGRRVRLTGTEYRLLECLMRSPNQILARVELCRAAIAGGTVVLERTIDVHICALRRKLRVSGLIQTVRGKGYRFRPP